MIKYKKEELWQKIRKTRIKNHRKRLKEKVKKYGLECLAQHEILELLLTYTIPRKDTNPIVHNLMNFFSSFSNVIDADYHDLLKVDGSFFRKKYSVKGNEFLVLACLGKNKRVIKISFKKEKMKLVLNLICIT